jgi:hypothetical protein
MITRRAWRCSGLVTTSLFARWEDASAFARLISQSFAEQFWTPIGWRLREDVSLVSLQLRLVTLN